MTISVNCEKVVAKNKYFHITALQKGICHISVIAESLGDDADLKRYLENKK
jgi:hypothetical protein